MSWEQEVRTVELSGETHSFDGAWLLLAPAVLLLAVHLLRALLVTEGTAVRWLQTRTLEVSPASIATVLGYLRRVRWTRVVAAAVVGVVAGLCLLLAQVPVGVVAASYLLAVVLSESLAPTARRGRVRTGSLVRRPRTYFAPLREVWLVRGLLVTAIPMALLAAPIPRATGLALVHAAAMLLALLLFELGLKVLTERGLPDRSGDLALDTAMRVQTARTATAAALLGSSAGWLWSAGLASFQLTFPLALSFAFGVAAQALFFGAIGLAVALSQPLRSWRPRDAAAPA